MQTTSTIVTYTCDICGMERQVTNGQEIPATWVHISDYDLDFCPGCMEAVYDAAVANKAWYTFKFGQTPTTTHSEKQYLELKHKYDELKSKYDAITTSKPYARSSDDPIMKMDMHSLEISHPI